MTRAQYYPEHDRTSCSDADPCNAEARGSCGCARCTAILLDQGDELRGQVQTLAGLLKRCARCLPPDHGTRKIATEYLREHGFLSPLRTPGVQAAPELSEETRRELLAAGLAGNDITDGVVVEGGSDGR